MIEIKYMAGDAFNTLDGLFSKFFKQMDGSLKGIGMGISTLVFALTGITLIIIAVVCLWQVKKNNGVSEIWEDHTTKIVWVLGICAASGLISLAFFGA